MRYGITRLALGAQPFIEITPEHFGQIRDAKQNLVLTLVSGEATEPSPA